ncbi:MAG TPA: TIGR02206 family membrane protein [Paenibacillus sp.]|jgi:hypothetical integral membrane protein (TIGR02206 family)
MDAFFSAGAMSGFVLLSLPHLLALVAVLLLILGLYYARITIRNHPWLRRTVRYGLAMLLLLSEASLNIWYLQQNLWDVRYTLPLELCSLTLLLSIIMLLTGSRWLYPFLFFAGIAGALQALLTPNLLYGFPHFRYFQFFISHAAIILASLYMTWIENYRLGWRSIVWAILMLNISVAAIWGVDHAIGANYMFLAHKPHTASLLDLLGPYPYYLLVEEGIALLMFIILYVVFFLLPDKIAQHNRIRKGARSSP